LATWLCSIGLLFVVLLGASNSIEKGLSTIPVVRFGIGSFIALAFGFEELKRKLSALKASHP